MLRLLSGDNKLNRNEYESCYQRAYYQILEIISVLLQIYLCFFYLLSIPLGDDGLNIPFMKLQLNLYTAPAFVSVLVAVLNCVLILVRLLYFLFLYC